MAGEENPLFDPLSGQDEEVAQAIAARIGMTLPVECSAGVAANARLIAHHVHIMRGDR